MLRMSHRNTVGCYKSRPYFRTGSTGLNIAVTELPATDLVSKYCADYGITMDAGKAVSQWDDSVSTNHLVQASSSKQPIWAASAIGTHSGITFNGSSHALTKSFTLNNAACTVYVVFSAVAWTAGKNVVDGYAARALLAQYGSSGEYIIYSGGIPPTRVAFATGTYFLASLVVSGNSSTLRNNNNTPTTMNGAGTNNPGGLSVGTSSDGAQYCNCTVTDIAVYSSCHDLATQDLVANYYKGHIPTLW